MSKLTNEQLKKLTTERLLALYKSKKASFRKAELYGPKEDEVSLRSYLKQIKYILDSRENVEEK